MDMTDKEKQETKDSGTLLSRICLMLNIISVVTNQIVLYDSDERGLTQVGKSVEHSKRRISPECHRRRSQHVP